MLTNQEVLHQLLNKNPAQILKLTVSEEKYLYNLGAKKCQIGDFATAMPLFQLLITINPSNYLYLKALAACQQNKREYLIAYCLYNCSYTFHKDENTDCLFYMGICQLELSKSEQARSCFEELIKLGGPEQLVARAKLLLSDIPEVVETNSTEE